MIETADANVTIDGDLTFKADPSRLKRLSENLFRNTIEHRGPAVSITVGALNHHPGFFIADDEPGIPATEQAQILEVSYTANEHSQKQYLPRSNARPATPFVPEHGTKNSVRLF